MPAASHLASQALLPSQLRTADWDALAAANPTLAAWVNERAFFMASVSQASTLQEFRDTAAALAAGKIGPQDARRLLRAHLAAAGYQASPPLRGSIKDLSTTARMKVTLETNLAQARGWAQHNTSMQNTTRPGFRLFRAGHAAAPRAWATRWQQAYAQLSPQEQQYATSGNNEADLCALKISRIWSLISRFGTPYPPFDFNSHMRLKSLTRQECTALGILPLDPAEQASIAAAQTAATPSLNEHTQASVPSLDPDLRAQLSTALRGIATLSGNTLTMVDQNGTKPYSWQQIGSVISTPNPAAPQLQLLAFRDWAANPARFSRHADDPAPLDEVEDLTRLLSRITPSPSASGSPTLRHIIPATDQAHLTSLLNSLTSAGTYTPPQDNPAQLWHHSRTTNPHAFSIILICRNYHTPIRPDTLYQAISASSPGYIFTPTARFRILRTLASTSNRHGGTTISIEVEELPPPSSPITNRLTNNNEREIERTPNGRFAKKGQGSILQAKENATADTTEKVQGPTKDQGNTTSSTKKQIVRIPSEASIKRKQENWLPDLLTHEQAKELYGDYKDNISQIQKRVKDLLLEKDADGNYQRIIIPTSIEGIKEVSMGSKSIGELMKKGHVFVSAKMGASPAVHEEAVLRTRELIPKAKKISIGEGGKKDAEIKTSDNKTKIKKDSVAYVLTAEADFTAEDNNKYIARFGFHIYHQEKMTPKVYSLICIRA